ncbi:hypothetical protein HK103_000724 [Boothiomyces macroporosus]|uniref:Leucine carboxyl methyltransferase 1 n=1 Tax=Boothiomyces macroporosus TaxID=261099 RepID=A0AAD5Y5R2_9FUNG|nr:hypothetical protein HK103_000724 [Boothiomyces macroporosus]
MQDPDETIRGTNDDALQSKLSAINAGYIDDKYASVFLKRGEKRAPIINRGTFTRTYSIDHLISKFIEKHERSQILSIGAGSDSRYFCLKDRNQQPTRYIEIDFPQITGKKAMTVCKNKQTKALLGEVSIENGGLDLYSEDYCLIAGDLREFKSKILLQLLSKGVDTSVPTLVLSECVMIYLDPTVSDMLIQTIAESFKESYFISFEQILPNDAFGGQMLHNLKLRGIELLGISAYPTIDSQIQRFIDHGFKSCIAHDMNTLYERYVPIAEKQR